jgi:hypothetical protein
LPPPDFFNQKAPIVHVEVDQSGKIGKTNEDTVLAFSNGLAYSVLISRQVKQQCVRELRRRGLSPQAIYLRLFAVGLHFLLRGYTSFGVVGIRQRELGLARRMVNRLGGA